MLRLSVLEEIRSLLVQGGWVMLPIFLLGLYAWTLLFERFFAYRRAKSRCEWGICERFRRAISQNAPFGKNAARHALEAERHSVEVDFSRSFPSISICAALAPMLGLLGTVSGMVHVFKTIQVFGFGNPVLLADGISEALLTTQAGLLVAFPLVVANNQLVARIERLKNSADRAASAFENEIFPEENA